MIQGDNIAFSTNKNFEYIRELGSGGFATTVLVKDKTTDFFFAIKKFSPLNKSDIDSQFSRFVDEIKILFTLTHNNIVRIYNYYLFPQQKTGYLQMEYINGVSIDKYKPVDDIKSWDEVFVETIQVFAYLESKQVLHRDIRPSNIMIDNANNVKVIDFGFGKRTSAKENFDNSILLNWPATIMPQEVVEHLDYNRQTEIYFLGILFQNLNKGDSFGYMDILSKMTRVKALERYSSFKEIQDALNKIAFDNVEFTHEEKRIYLDFVEAFCSHITAFTSTYISLRKYEKMISDLGMLVRCSKLETYIQDNAKLIRCFLDCGVAYKNKLDIRAEVVMAFYNLILAKTPLERDVILDNIHVRFCTIPFKPIDSDDLPF